MNDILFALICIAVVIAAFGLCMYLMKPSKQSEQENFAPTKSGTITLYYSPSCPHCHSFMPIWNKFAAKCKIKSQKIDCSKNKCIDAVRGYPTVILQKANGDVITFNGQRTIDELESFVDNN